MWVRTEEPEEATATKSADDAEDQNQGVWGLGFRDLEMETYDRFTDSRFVASKYIPDHVKPKLQTLTLNSLFASHTPRSSNLEVCSFGL